VRYRPNIYLRDPAQPNGEASFARPFWSDSQGGAASSLFRPLAPVARYLSLKTRRLPGISTNGASRDRTGDLLLAKQALSQLSYGPVISECRATASSHTGRYAALYGCPGDCLLVEVEVARRPLLEPEALLLGCIAQEVGSLLEHVLDGRVYTLLRV
jgi:hypothetical protein